MSAYLGKTYQGCMMKFAYQSNNWSTSSRVVLIAGSNTSLVDIISVGESKRDQYMTDDRLYVQYSNCTDMMSQEMQTDL